MPLDELKLFALNTTRSFGERVAAALGVPLAEHEERAFEDGEHKSRALESVRAKDVYVVQSLYGDNEQSVNDKLCRLLFFLGALRDADAGRITAVLPYLCYARKDRKTQPRDPVTTRYVAALFEAVGVERVVTMDVHNRAAFQNAFRCRTEHLEARRLFVDHLRPKLQGVEVAVVAPDAGGIKRAEQFRQTLSEALEKEIPTAFIEKQRAHGIVSGKTLVGEVAGRAAVIIDDLISTGTTLSRAARACRDRGATRVFAVATHGLFIPPAENVLAKPDLEAIAVTDTVPPFRLDPAVAAAKLEVLDAAGFFAEAIRRLHTGGSLVELNG